MNFYSRYLRPERSGFVVKDPSLTKQSFAKESDINTIVGRYLKGSSLPTGERQPQYGDFVGMDYQAMQNQIAGVNQSFAELPADVRRRFSNDPGEMLAYLGDPANQDEAIGLGLLPPRPVEEGPEKGLETPPSPTPAAPVTPPTPAA